MESHNITRHMELAVRAAHNGQHRQHQMGAILTHSGRIISIGMNSHKSHPKMGRVKTLHAEVSCLIGVRYQDLKGSTMYVARVNKNGKVGMAKPCSICQAVLAEYNVLRIYYTNSAGQIEKMELK